MVGLTTITPWEFCSTSSSSSFGLPGKPDNKSPAQYFKSPVTPFTRSWRSDDTNKKVYLLDAQDKVEPRVGERAQMKGTHHRTSLMNVNEFDRQRVMALMDGKTLRFTVSQRNSFLCVWTPPNALYNQAKSNPAIAPSINPSTVPITTLPTERVS